MSRPAEFDSDQEARVTNWMDERTGRSKIPVGSNLARLDGENPRLACDCFSTFTRRAVLVRSAEQIHRRPLNRQAEGEEPGGAVEGLARIGVPGLQQIVATKAVGNVLLST